MTHEARILVVDDEATVLFFLEELFSREGYEVVAAQSSEAALSRLALQRVDVAVIDLRMRGIGGIEVLRALRERSPATAAIVLTAHGDLETAIEALRLGAHDYLLKPCAAEDLRECVRTALLKRQREHRQRALLAELELNLERSLDEIRATVLRDETIVTEDLEGADLQSFLATSQGLLRIDVPSHTITIDGRPLSVSSTEFKLLAYLADQAPRVVSSVELARKVLGYECDRHEASNLIRHRIYRIRQEAREAAGRDIIRTVRSVGYTIDLS